MNWKHLLGYVAMAGTIAACGGESETKAPDININVEVIEVIGPSAPEDNITNTALPIVEDFDSAVDAVAFFNASYAPLTSESASDAEDNFYHSTAGVFQADGSPDPDPNAWITKDADQHLRIGNARFTIGQIVSVYASTAADEPRRNSTPGTLPDDTSSWGELDLAAPFTVSFCVVARSEGGNFFIYVDNNSTSSGNSIHGSGSRAVNVPQSSLVAGQRASFDVEVGTPNSFIQFRADSGGWLVLDDLVIENAANPAADQPACAGKTTEFTLSPDGNIDAPLTGVPFAGLPDVGGSFGVDFSVGSDNFFGTSEAATTFLSMSDDAADPFYKVTSGASRIAISDNKLSMNNARLTIGDRGAGTSDATLPAGNIDLSAAYRITIVISDFTDADPADDPGKFQVYIDNNTTSSGNSTHGGSSKIFEIAVGDIDVSSPYTLVLEPEIGTTTSFLQLRADSRVENITIDSITIEYLSAVVETISWNIFNGDAHPFDTDSLTLANGSSASFESSSSRPDGADYYTNNMDGTVMFDTASADSSTDPRLYARHQWPAPAAPVYPRYLTVLMGVTGNAVDARVIEMDARLSDGTEGARIKVLLRADGSNQGVQVENIDGSEDPAAYDAGTPYTGFRIYQIAVELTSATTGTVSVYEPNTDTPLISYTGTLNATSDNYVRFGEASGSNYQGMVDWIVWTEDGAYLPSELLSKLPTGLGVITGYE